MVEIKLSQGAKPAHGGLLPGSKVTEIIAEARGVNVGEDCNSPPFHSAFSGPHELIEFVAKLRELSGGKPIGFKMCVGHPVEFASIVRAIVDVGVEHGPDFITIDGSEGGTGAAPPAPGPAPAADDSPAAAGPRRAGRNRWPAHAATRGQGGSGRRAPRGAPPAA